MDLHQIEYIIAIEQEGSISKAAEKFFLTQSALNQQLLRLEKELGVQLFERRKHSMIPTLAGRMYLTTAHQMVDLKSETYKVIHDIAKENTGEISVAHTPERGSVMFPYLYPVFHKRYPQVTFRIQEARVPQMEQMLFKKETVLACLTYLNNDRNPELDYFDLKEELIVFALPKSHPLASLAGRNSAKLLPEIDLRLLSHESFTIPSHQTIIRRVIDGAFRSAGYKPEILFEPTSTMTAFQMVNQQISPSFFPQSYVDPEAPIVYFSLPGRPTWMRSIACLKGSYLTLPEKYYIELSKKFLSGIPLE